MKHLRKPSTRSLLWLNVPAAILVLTAILAIGFVAPTEATMGHAQRIVYLHVAVAWVGLAGLGIAAVAGVGYLLQRRLDWDHWAQAAAELGWLACSLTLITGSLWARQAWGTWWTWDPRLTTALILWMIYSGYLVVRAGLDDPHRRARVAAVLALVGALDVPLVVMATRWFRGIHPTSPAMEPRMRAVLWLSAAGFTALFSALWVRRRDQLRLEHRLAAAQQRLDLFSADPPGYPSTIPIEGIQ